MHVTYRSYLTAGVAALGAGAIALAPVQPIPDNLAFSQDKAVSTLAVNLASTIDPITPWVDTFKLAAENVAKLAEFYLEKPFPLLQTIGANIGTYIQELPDFQKIFGQITNNINTFFYAPWSPGDPAGEYISNAVVTRSVPLSIPITQQFAFNLLPTVLGDAYPPLEPIINFTATHYSGQVMGLIGPLFAPLVQLTRSFTAIGQYFQDGDVTGAINELINIPANVTNAVLNGDGYLDLTGVVNAIQPLPPEVTSIGLNLGGVISPPVPAEGTVEEPTALNGGVMFDSLAADIAYRVPPFGPTVRVNDPGIPVSWVGSVIGLGQFLGQEMLVPPPPPTAAVGAAATDAAPLAAEIAPAVADTPAKDPVAAEDPAPTEDLVPVVRDLPAAAEDSAPAADAVTAKEEAPAAQAVSKPTARKSAADNDDAGKGRASHKGSRGKHAG